MAKMTMKQELEMLRKEVETLTFISETDIVAIIRK